MAVLSALALLVLVWRADRRFVADANARIAGAPAIDAPPLPDDWKYADERWIAVRRAAPARSSRHSQMGGRAQESQQVAT